ncbi:response regulator [Bowmanella dokdonensis]|uniref:Response regulator n=1 Tax=Bowmanella dokdonensis TaxID=751969 RepID=A0A939DMJ2_9ALTE|nr:response regulator [Bowmanella dokdonensis]MBN7824556.1 response regulator [Bowmanella dokdonensis]
MESGKINIAIVEDNGVARLNLRNHLLEMGFSDVGCYSHGRELKPVLRQRHFDLILMDFHLGLHKNGVEVVNELQKEGLLKPSTSVVFVTSDRMPMIVGQIVDVHPDALVLKPYTIKNLERTLSGCIRLNQYLRPVLKLMDQDQYQQALDRLNVMLENNPNPKIHTSMIKLKARLLIKLSRFKEAARIYEQILEGSDKVIWARWGLIQCTNLAGETEKSEEMLESMLGTHLTNDKACEWLTRINIDKEDYDKAELYIDKIKDGELSLSAARLKAHLYQAQDRMDDAIALLEKKRESNRNIREKFIEISLDLARCYLTLAESKPENERPKQLQVARFLIGSAGRNLHGQEMDIKRNVLTALAALMEGDTEKARELLSAEGGRDAEQMDIATPSDAVNAWHGLGEQATASELLHELEQRLKGLPDENEKTVSNLMMHKNQTALGDKKSRALTFNKQGLEFYVKDEFAQAIDLFYQAYLLFPAEAAFSVNLLQSMVEAGQAEHKKASIESLLNELSGQNLSKANAERVTDIREKIRKQKLI